MDSYEIHEIEQNDLNDGIYGWYWCDDDSTPDDWSWNNRGNGPEVTSDHVHGPFDSRESAEADAIDCLSATGD